MGLFSTLFGKKKTEASSTPSAPAQLVFHDLSVMAPPNEAGQRLGFYLPEGMQLYAHEGGVSLNPEDLNLTAINLDGAIEWQDPINIAEEKEWVDNKDSIQEKKWLIDTPDLIMYQYKEKYLTGDSLNVSCFVKHHVGEMTFSMAVYGSMHDMDESYITSSREDCELYIRIMQSIDYYDI